MSDEPVSGPSWVQSDRLTFAGLLGFSTVCVLQLLGLPSLCPLLVASLYCFAAAIPLLARSLHVTLKKVPGSRGVRRLRRLFDLIGVLGAVVGFALIVFHLNFCAGVMFLALCGLAIGLVKWV